MNPSMRLPPAAAAARIGRVGSVTSYSIDSLPTLVDCVRLLASPEGHSTLAVWMALARFAETTPLPTWLVNSNHTGMDVVTLARTLGIEPSLMGAVCAELEKLGVLTNRTISFPMIGLTAFLGETCVRDVRGWIAVWRLRRRYEDWCSEKGRPPLPISEFRRAMAEAGFREGRSRRGVNEDGTRPNVQLRSWEGLSER